MTSGHDVLVVGWFPASDDPGTGRFIADQAAALNATGRARATVVSFEPLTSAGDVSLRTEAAEAWPAAVTAALATGRALAPAGANGPPAVPVLRLGVTGGTTATATWTNQAEHRARALAVYLDASERPPLSLIHCHVGYPEGAAVAATAPPRGIPYVLTEHATFLDRLLGQPEQREAYGAAARGAARVIAVGAGLAQRIIKAFPDLADRVVVVPNAIAVADFRAAPMAQRRPDELLFVGYRREIKGIDVLLEAVALARSRRPVTLRLIGSSPDEELERRWHALAASLGIADAVTFEPPTDRAGVAAAMAEASLFVHASRLETFGVVAAEALASGLPVVAADSGGVTEILGREPRHFGALVPAGDAEALASAILETLERRGDFDPLRLRSWVETQYGDQVVAERLIHLYDAVLAEHGRGAADPRSSVGRPAGERSELAWNAPTVIVALDRAAFDRARAHHPAWVTAGARIVTCGPAFPDAHLVPPDLAQAMTRFLAGPIGVRHLPSAGKRLVAPLVRRRQARLQRTLLPGLGAVVREALDAVLEGRPEPAWLVCLGGLDVLVATSLHEQRARIAPGGLRWLGDQRWSQRRAAPADPSSS